MVVGVVSPLALYPAPFTDNCVIVSVDVPVFDNVKFCDFVCPSTTLPKSKLAGETFSPACVPVPLNTIVTGEPALLATVMLPAAFPAEAGANRTARVAVCAGFNVAGAVTPLTLYPAPAATTLLICSAALPVFVNVIFCEALLPAATLPKLRLVGFAVNCPAGAVVPVPLSAMVNGDPVASLATKTLPLAFPAAVGANFALTVALCEGFNVTGVETPLTLKPVPAAITLLILTATVPEFVNIIFCDALLPTDTLEKFRLVGFAVNCPKAAVVPVPLKLMFAVGVLGSLVVRVRPPDTTPAAAGVNVTTTGTVCPALIVFGVAIPLMLNSAPFSVIIETVKSAAPVFPMTKLAAPLEPTLTVPKSSALVFNDNCGCDVVMVPARLTTPGVAPAPP
jgi:hypothetical protein